jgi:hypothetical protein
VTKGYTKELTAPSHVSRVTGASIKISQAKRTVRIAWLARLDLKMQRMRRRVKTALLENIKTKSPGRIAKNAQAGGSCMVAILAKTPTTTALTALLDNTG